MTVVHFGDRDFKSIPQETERHPTLLYWMVTMVWKLGRLRYPDLQVSLPFP